MTRNTLVGSWLLLGWMCSPLPAMAQGVGAIGGTIADASGAVLPGVTVTLSNPGTIGGNQEAVTTDRGTFLFPRLVPGRYSVRASLTGFRPAVQENVIVNADVTARVDLRLEVGQLQEAITVTGDPPLLDTTSALKQTVLSADTLQTLPNRIDVWGIAKMIPGSQWRFHPAGRRIGTVHRFQPGDRQPVQPGPRMADGERVCRRAAAPASCRRGRLGDLRLSQDGEQHRRNQSRGTLDSYIPLEVTEVMSGRQVTVFNQAPALRGRLDVLFDNASELDNEYNGVDLTVQKRLTEDMEDWRDVRPAASGSL